MNTIRQRAAKPEGKLPFDKVLRRGKNISSGGIKARVMPHDAPQMGIAVSRRYGNAVDRNLFKRRVRAAYRQHWPDLPNIAIVLSPVLGRKNASYADINELFIKLCEYDA